MMLRHLQVCLLKIAVALLLPPQVVTLTTITYTGSTTTIDCPVQADFLFPDWRGPPNLLVYYQGGTGQFNPNLGEKLDRLSIAANNRSLIMTNTRLSDSGVYTCTKTADGILYQAGVTMQVRSRPSKPNITTPVPVDSNGIRGTEDEHLTVTCTSCGGYPAPTVEWYMHNISGKVLAKSNNGTQDGDTYTVTLNYTFVPSRQDDKQKLVCRSYFPTPVDSQASQETSLTLFLYLKPDEHVVRQLPDVATTGDNVSIECRTSGSRPEANITWVYRGQKYTPVVTAEEDTTTQTFTTVSVLHRSVTAIDNGQPATCIVTHMAMAKALTESTTLTVQYPPAVTIYTEDATVLNTSTTITCSASGVPANYIYSEWIHSWNGQIVARLPNTPVLTLTGLSYEHSGDYICRATNGIGGYQQGFGMLLVKSFPRVIQPDSTYEVVAEIDKTVSVNVTFYSNSGDVSVKCYRQLDNRVVGIIKVEDIDISLPVFDHFVSSKGYRAAISIAISGENDYGEYAIIISNDIGSSDVVIKITTGEPPNVPEKLDTHVLSFRSVNVSWSVGYSGGLEQTFVLQITTDQSTWREIFVHGDQMSPGTRMFHVIDRLSADTIYHIRIFSKNKKGSSSLSRTLQFRTKFTVECTAATADSNNSALIGTSIGGLVGGVLLTICIHQLITRFRGRSQGKPTSRDKLSKDLVVEEHPVELQIQPSSANTDGPPNVYESLNDAGQPAHMYSDIRPTTYENESFPSNRKDYMNM